MVAKKSEDTAQKEKSSVSELVGKPAVETIKEDIPEESSFPVPNLVGQASGLVVDERVLPDSGLPTEFVEGILDIANEGSGLLRPKFAASEHDIYISASQIRRFNLRVGDLVGGQARRPKENERYWGFGQRALIVSPPKAGKTWLLKDIISGIAKNYPENSKGKGKKVHLMAVLIGERPEEVTDILRATKEATDGLGEVAASNFDEAPVDQTRVGELALERAKRIVEHGVDVVILLDSITRMARAYNLALPTSGRTLTGGFDPVALYPAKKFFGAARKIENGGSLTIIGTCLVETGSRMDDLIYEEFKGTGNMELHLTRKLADRRVFPSIDVSRSGTRQEELLYGKDALPKIHTLRRMLELVSEDERTETLLERLKKAETNKDFLDSLKVA
ncbi:MAG: Transcription termination factor Rho [Candidatus Woesebacteria bacterium GW2011_GWB1_43_14]|uniref:Transcription termination factor Rho n=1 Tax=Candidatus Woesebacteria bacterium GW2011_GWB1_43_14 TaxID=1618578 RepID=A0A0G1DMI1_9BACT|nr:MAG: Transcription termination factor Rho [Candidatus Woesebacteria bacterium GW2011_GWB1_43_14]